MKNIEHYKQYFTEDAEIVEKDSSMYEEGTNDDDFFDDFFSDE